MKVREPVARPLDVIFAELLLSGSQALLVGLLTYLAVGIWDERSVGGGPVAVILALLALAVGAGWLYWLVGGAGWPLAAANVPVGIFVAAALLLGLGGGQLLALEPLPLLLMLAASLYGVVAGVFLDPPRRWRWDQRQRPRWYVEPPRISEPTRAVLATLARRGQPAGPDPANGPGSGHGPVPAHGPVPTLAESSRPPRARTADAPSSGGMASTDTVAGPGAAPVDGPIQPTSPSRRAKASSPVARAASAPRATAPRNPARGPGIDRTGSARPLARSPARPAARGAPPPNPAPAPPVPPEPRASPAPSGAGVELPTSVEPRSQKSPWAWARPPEWNRDEDDEQVDGARS